MCGQIQICWFFVACQLGLEGHVILEGFFRGALRGALLDLGVESIMASAATQAVTWEKFPAHRRSLSRLLLRRGKQDMLATILDVLRALCQLTPLEALFPVNGEMTDSASKTVKLKRAKATSTSAPTASTASRLLCQKASARWRPPSTATPTP